MVIQSVLHNKDLVSTQEHHPAAVYKGNNSFVKTYARDHAMSYIHLMTYDHDARCYVFDGLHGAINSIDICVQIVKQIDMNNEVNTPLVDIMSDILPSLYVPGKEEHEFSVTRLNGNDSMMFLNNFDVIAMQLLGVHTSEVEDSDDQRVEEHACIDVLWIALTELRQEDPKVDRCLRTAEQHMKNCKATDGWAEVGQEEEEDEDDDEDADEDEDLDPMFGLTGMDQSDDDDDDDVPLTQLRSASEQAHIARRGALRLLLRMQRTLSDALACMMCVNVDKSPECVSPGGGDAHDALIDAFDTNIHLFGKVRACQCACVRSVCAICVCVREREREKGGGRDLTFAWRCAGAARVEA